MLLTRVWDLILAFTFYRRSRGWLSKLLKLPAPAKQTIAFGLKPVVQVGPARPTTLQIDRVSAGGNLFVRCVTRRRQSLAATAKDEDRLVQPFCIPCPRLGQTLRQWYGLQIQYLFAHRCRWGSFVTIEADYSSWRAGLRSADA